MTRLCCTKAHVFACNSSPLAFGAVSVAIAALADCTSRWYVLPKGGIGIGCPDLGRRSGVAKVARSLPLQLEHYLVVVVWRSWLRLLLVVGVVVGDLGRCVAVILAESFCCCDCEFVAMFVE